MRRALAAFLIMFAEIIREYGTAAKIVGILRQGWPIEFEQVG
jgi:hypothetical protein